MITTHILFEHFPKHERDELAKLCGDLRLDPQDFEISADEQPRQGSIPAQRSVVVLERRNNLKHTFNGIHSHWVAELKVILQRKRP